MCNFNGINSTETFSLLIDLSGLLIQIVEFLEVSKMKRKNVVGFIGCFGRKTTTEEIKLSLHYTILIILRLTDRVRFPTSHHQQGVFLSRLAFLSKNLTLGFRFSSEAVSFCS